MIASDDSLVMCPADNGECLIMLAPPVSKPTCLVCWASGDERHVDVPASLAAAYRTGGEVAMYVLVDSHASAYPKFFDRLWILQHDNCWCPWAGDVRDPPCVCETCSMDDSYD